MEQYTKDVLTETRNTFDRCLSDQALITSIRYAATAVVNSLAAGNKIMLVGNGGSAADCQHIAGELVGRFMKERDGIPAIALTTDTSVLTAIGNDYGYDQIFAKQVLALGKSGDVLMSISTSGSSPSILNAMAAAKVIGVTNIALTGSNESPMLNLADISVRVPDTRTPYIQQVHITIGHIMCGMVEGIMFSDG